MTEIILELKVRVVDAHAADAFLRGFKQGEGMLSTEQDSAEVSHVKVKGIDHRA